MAEINKIVALRKDLNYAYKRAERSDAIPVMFYRRDLFSLK
jgi:hypothetical protein